MPYLSYQAVELGSLAQASPLPPSLQQQQIFSYCTTTFPFKELVSEILGIEGELLNLHTTQQGRAAMEKESKKRRKDQFVKTWRSSNGSAARKRFNTTLQNFADNFIAMRMSETALEPSTPARVAYQKEPILRVILPSDTPSTPLHCDADYHHPPAEVNWWLPLTPVHGTNSLYIETRPGLADFVPVSCEYGQVLRFYGNLCQHYTVPNMSGTTRVSLDMRVLAMDYHNKDWRDRMGRPSIYMVDKYYVRAGSASDMQTNTDS